MKHRSMLVASIMAVVAFTALFCAPTANAELGPECTTNIIDNTTDRQVETAELRSILELSTVLSNINRIDAEYYVHAFDRLPNNVSANDYFDWWIARCMKYATNIDPSDYDKTRGYAIVIVGIDNTEVDVFSSLVNSANIDRLRRVREELRANINDGDISYGIKLALRDISRLIDASYPTSTPTTVTPTPMASGGDLITERDESSSGEPTGTKVVIYCLGVLVIIITLTGAVMKHRRLQRTSED